MLRAGPARPCEGLREGGSGCRPGGGEREKKKKKQRGGTRGGTHTQPRTRASLPRGARSGAPRPSAPPAPRSLRGRGARASVARRPPPDLVGPVPGSRGGSFLAEPPPSPSERRCPVPARPGVLTVPAFSQGRRLPGRPPAHLSAPPPLPSAPLRSSPLLSAPPRPLQPPAAASPPPRGRGAPAPRPRNKLWGAAGARCAPPWPLPGAPRCLPECPPPASPEHRSLRGRAASAGRPAPGSAAASPLCAGSPPFAFQPPPHHHHPPRGFSARPEKFARGAAYRFSSGGWLVFASYTWGHPP